MVEINDRTDPGIFYEYERDRCKDIIVNLKSNYSHLDQDKDIRIRYFAECLVLLRSYSITFKIVHHEMNDINWWNSFISGVSHPQSIRQMQLDYWNFSRFSFLLQMFSKFEDLIRSVSFGIGAIPQHRDKGIYKLWIENIETIQGMSKYHEFFMIFNGLRNCIHNFWIYTDPFGSDRTYNYANDKLLLRHNKEARAIYEKFIMQICRDCISCAYDIILQPNIISVPTMEDRLICTSPIVNR